MKTVTTICDKCGENISGSYKRGVNIMQFKWNVKMKQTQLHRFDTVDMEFDLCETCARDIIKSIREDKI